MTMLKCIKDEKCLINMMSKIELGLNPITLSGGFVIDPTLHFCYLNVCCAPNLHDR